MSDKSQQEEKQTNKLFDQSELDRIVAREKSKEREKYADYEDMKAKLNDLVKEKNERELSEKSEIEKANIRLQEQSKYIEELNEKNKKLRTESTRNEILNDSRYKDLPRAYKNLVMVTDDVERIKASADEVLKEYERDFSVKSGSFGGPVSETKKSEDIAAQKELERSSLASQIKDAVTNFKLK